MYNCYSNFQFRISLFSSPLLIANQDSNNIHCKYKSNSVTIKNIVSVIFCLVKRQYQQFAFKVENSFKQEAQMGLV